jgi:hypothetical protein
VFGVVNEFGVVNAFGIVNAFWVVNVNVQWNFKRDFKSKK